MSTYFFCVKKRLFSNKWMMFLNIMVSSLAMAFLCLAVTIPQILHHGENSIKRSLAKDLSMYGVIRNGDNAINNENISNYIQDIYDSPEVEGIGTWDYSAFEDMTTVNSETDYWKEIREIQSSHIKEFGQDSNVQFVYMLGQAFPINDPELCRGSAEQVGTNDGWLLYLGYNFRDIPVGTVFANEPYGISYTVAGILRENASIMDQQAILWNLEVLRFNYSIAADNMLVVIPPCSTNYHSMDYFFVCADGYTYEEAVARIMRVAEQYDIQTETGRLDRRLDTVLSYADGMLNIISGLAGLLAFASLVMLLTAQLLTALFRKDELGVWRMLGMSRKKIFGILLGENVIKMLVAAILSLGYILSVERIYITLPSIAHELRYILWGNIPIFLLLCALVAAAACAAVPMAYVQDKSIPDIVRGTWE
ncbi:MAG: FtsX-like permease family protein [Clostridium sp.]|nr:FtsX-like permease family protein [Acetatifactor muris]MCM1526993.1 FtsX-like permease family protein [Bacteroides sp.]MCM1563156.1 FtsX-like permease family protein [Clostridium sp.]